MHYLVKTLTFRLIKSDKNYYLNTITVVLYFLYVLSYQMNFQKFSKVVMDLNCLSQIMLISRLHDNQKSGNI